MTISEAIAVLKPLTQPGRQSAPLMPTAIDALRTVLVAVEAYRSEIKHYRLRRHDGSTEEVCGSGPGDAMARAGYAVADLGEFADIEVMTG